MNAESARKDVADAIDALVQQAVADAEEAILCDPKKLLERVFADDIYISMNGMGYAGPKELPPLTCYLRSIDFGTLLTHDPVADVITTIEDDNLDAAEAGQMIEESISTLQGGIDRLRAYAAKRLTESPATARR